MQTIGIIPSATPDDRLAFSMRRCDAMGSPPDIEAWMTLVATLQIAAGRAQQGENHPLLPDGLGVIAEYANAFGDFLLAHPWAHAEGLQQPLGRLLAAIMDLANGKTPELFKPIAKVGNRPKDETIGEIIKGQAARALDELISAGEPTEQAASKVLRVLRAGNVLGAKRWTPRTIERWRYRLREGEGAMSPVALAHFRQALRPDAGATHAQRAEWLLGTLRNALAIKGPKDSQEPPGLGRTQDA
jgi:hypothetical protein